MKQNCELYYMFAADAETGFVTGYGFHHSTDQVSDQSNECFQFDVIIARCASCRSLLQEIVVTRMWQILLPKASQRIVQVVTKRAIGMYID